MGDQHAIDVPHKYDATFLGPNGLLRHRSCVAAD